MAESRCPHIDKSESAWRCRITNRKLINEARDCHYGKPCGIRTDRAESDVNRLRAVIGEPVRSFGTLELIEWANGLQEIISEYPEGERDSIAFYFVLGGHLEKFAKSWNSPAMQELQRKNTSLREALEPFAKAADMSDELNHGNIPDTASYYVRVGDLRKARAALGSGDTHRCMICGVSGNPDCTVNGGPGCRSAGDAMESPDDRPQDGMRKDPDHYSAFGWKEPDDLCYVWPNPDNGSAPREV